MQSHNETIRIKCKICGKEYAVSKLFKSRVSIGNKMFCYCTFCALWGRPKKESGETQEDIEEIGE